MDRLSRAYRFCALVAVTAMVWGLAIPVVHLACATGPQPAPAHCEDEETVSYGPMQNHEKGGHAHDAAMHQDGAAQEAMMPCPVSGEADARCCVIEAAPVSRKATPGLIQVDKAPPAPATEALSTAISAPAAPMSSLGLVRGSPPLPSPSYLDFSVLLL